jgi:hypothetical protein
MGTEVATRKRVATFLPREIVDRRIATRRDASSRLSAYLKFVALPILLGSSRVAARA